VVGSDDGSRLTRASADSLGVVDVHEDSYVCTHVFDLVGMAHVVDADASLRAVLDLAANHEAERSAVGAAWSRSAF
jgi:hypothetical protein